MKKDKDDTGEEAMMKYLLGPKNEHTPRARRRKMQRALKKLKSNKNE